jgi:myo-inositol-1-phosphate synthase
MTDSKKIRIAIIGVGNCASSLIQGLHKYKDVDENSGFVHGIAHNKIGDYLISDIEVVVAFDVDGRKVDKDLSEAIFAEPNCTTKFYDVPKTGIIVQKGPVLDGILESQDYVYDFIDKNQMPVDVCKVLLDNRVDIVVNYLPSGSIEATHYYAGQALNANCSFVNAIAVELANDPVWMKKFKEKGLVLAGDDIKSQLGSTVLHQTIMDLFVKRGVYIESTHQINLGGNTDFKNLSNPERFKEKYKCKQGAIESSILYNTNASLLPCTYTNGLNDNKL